MQQALWINHRALPRADTSTLKSHDTVPISGVVVSGIMGVNFELVLFAWG
ncbi:predicted protein [Sclerotinia sclerotiorum 1980 UF-70]|uniref:Uncharacterized protein n=1 Tax=Sclerotinia sclerotiorum (strain ATCC 18683 / 1980 / Ss-1) TaxID=665079 RepID=A7E772_SCLS1|nr:predicted protein [Sclerotinia sclerotiorum 1980 UF-70]EDN96224.1 predicted protein [Sclerotinia sclerotiorum 1980 UF-70]